MDLIHYILVSKINPKLFSYQNSSNFIHEKVKSRLLKYMQLYLENKCHTLANIFLDFIRSSTLFLEQYNPKFHICHRYNLSLIWQLDQNHSIPMRLPIFYILYSQV